MQRSFMKELLWFEAGNGLGSKKSRVLLSSRALPSVMVDVMVEDVVAENPGKIGAELSSAARNAKEQLQNAMKSACSLSEVLV